MSEIVSDGSSRDGMRRAFKEMHDRDKQQQTTQPYPLARQLTTKLRLPYGKGKEIEGILSGLVNVRTYKIVQEQLESDEGNPGEVILKLFAIIDVLKLKPEDCTLTIGDVHAGNSIVTITLPKPYEWGVSYTKDNRFVLTQ